MPFADVNGQRIRFEDSGGDGPPVILSHGFLMDREMFAPQVEALRPEFRVITWDERGFGETEFDGEPFTYWDSARDCLGLLDHLGIEQAVLGGMSQGGFLSMRAALLAPDRVRALVLIDTQSGAEDPERLPAYRQMQETWLQVGPVDELAQAIAGLIIGDPVISETWIAKWRKLPREAMHGAVRLPVRARRHHRPRRRDHLPGDHLPRHRRHVDRGRARPQELSDGLPGCTGVVLHRGRPARLEPDPPRAGQRAAAASSCARSSAPGAGRYASQSPKRSRQSE